MFPKPLSGKKERARRKRALQKYRKKVHFWVLRSDKNLCRHCLERAGEQTHHCYRKGVSPEDHREHPDSILTLCFKCHNAHESEGTISKEELIEDLKRAVAKRPPLPDWVREK